MPDNHLMLGARILGNRSRQTENHLGRKVPTGLEDNNGARPLRRQSGEACPRVARECGLRERAAPLRSSLLLAATQSARPQRGDAYRRFWLAKSPQTPQRLQRHTK